MKKQLLFIAVFFCWHNAYTVINRGVHTPPPTHHKGSTPPAEQPITSAAGLVAAYPTSQNQADILAAAAAYADSNGGSSGNASSAAGTATATFLATGQAPAPTSSSSKRMGRLGK